MYAEIKGDVYFLGFWSKILSLGKVGPQIQIFLLKVKFDIYLNKLQYAEFNGAVYFFCFGLKMPSLSKFGPKY